MNQIKPVQIFSKYSYSILLMMLLFSWVLIMSLLSPHFLTTSNFSTVLTRMSEECLVAVGITMVVLSGGIDLSVGAVMAMVPVLIGTFYGGGMPFALALMLALSAGIIVGLVNAFLIQVTRIQPMIATLATMTITRSIVYAITSGTPLNTFPVSFFAFSKGQLLGVSNPIIVMLLFVVAGTWFLKRTNMGRFIYAVGGSESAAQASGVNVKRVRFLVFFISALCASLAGTMLASRLSVANSDAGMNTALDVLTAVLLGGTSIRGGEGSLPRSVVGVLIMCLVINGFNLLNISSFWQLVVMGTLLIIIVGIDAKRREGVLRKLASKLQSKKSNQNN